MTKRWPAWALVLALLAGGVYGMAQESAAPSNQASASNYIPEGTRFVVLLDSKLESSKLQSGKQFKAKLGEDLTAPNGQAIARGSKLKGHVSSADQGLHGRMLLAFDSIETQHGWMPIASTVVDVPGEHGVKTGNEGEIEKSGLNKQRVAESTVAGAAVGAGTGAIAGGSHGALIGAAAGAALGGTAGALSDRNLTLNKGQQLELQLDRPLEVPMR